jgi:alkanesulfonate monooxygenase SsuD/methylene tetrahydromethanopterin reductase-like flavin-dependent oxidoreductase (luciferase family)
MPLTTLRFGINIHTRIQADSHPVREAVDAEQLGFDVVTVHRDVLHGTDPSFEIWTLLTWLAAQTSRIRLAPNVLALPNRHPAVLAKMAETLSRLCGGRLLLVLGSGAVMNEAAVGALGLAQRSPKGKVEALEEAIDLMRGLWSTSDFSYAGHDFRAEAATIEPKPSQQIPIWLGVFGDRMVDLVGRKADGWLPSLPFLEPEQAYRKLALIRRVAEGSGRNPADITYGYNVPVRVEAGTHTVPGQLAGSAEEVARQLADFAQHGFTFLSLWPHDGTIDPHERLARDVIPIVRDLVS